MKYGHGKYCVVYHSTTKKAYITKEEIDFPGIHTYITYHSTYVSAWVMKKIAKWWYRNARY